MREPDTRQKLDDLDARLAALRSARAQEGPHQEDHYTQGQVAWRMVTEMVAGLGIGFGIGYGLDALFGSTPWMMLVWTLLGLAAGINVMMRTAKEVQDKQAAAQAGQTEARQGTKDERNGDGDGN